MFGKNTEFAVFVCFALTNFVTFVLTKSGALSSIAKTLYLDLVATGSLVSAAFFKTKKDQML